MGNTQTHDGSRLPRYGDLSSRGGGAGRQAVWLGACTQVEACAAKSSGAKSAAHEAGLERQMRAVRERDPDLCVTVPGSGWSLMHRTARWAKREGLVRCVWECSGERALLLMRHRAVGGYTVLYCLAMNPDMTRGMYTVFAEHCTEDDLRAADDSGWTVLFRMAVTFMEDATTELQEENIASVMCAVVQRLGLVALLAETTKESSGYHVDSTPRSILHDAGDKGRALLQRLMSASSSHSASIPAPTDAAAYRALQHWIIRHTDTDISDNAEAYATAFLDAGIATEAALRERFATDPSLLQELIPSRADREALTSALRVPRPDLAAFPSRAHKRSTPENTSNSGTRASNTAQKRQADTRASSKLDEPSTGSGGALAKGRKYVLQGTKDAMRLVKVVPGLGGAADLAMHIMTCVDEAADAIDTANEIIPQLQIISDALVELHERVTSAEGGALHRFALTKVARVTSDLESLASEIRGVRGDKLLRLFRGGKIKALLKSIEDNLQQALSWCTTAFMVAQADISSSSEGKASTPRAITDPLVLLEQEHVAQMRFPPNALQHDQAHRLGSGGFAQIYEGVLRPFDVRDERVPERVAIKNISATAFPELLRGLREMERQSQLSHANVVSLYGFAVTEAALDASSADGHLLIAMELAELGDLHDAIELPSIAEEAGRVATPDTALTAELRAGFLLQVAEAIDYVHSQGLVHRDIKSHNCVIFRDLTLKLTDFGISRTVNEQMTMTQQMGTEGYMAPEVRKHQRYDERADIFSFGVLAGEMLVRCIPAKRLKMCPPPPDDMLRIAAEDASRTRGAARVGSGRPMVAENSTRPDPAAAYYGDSEGEEQDEADERVNEEISPEGVQRELWDAVFRIHQDCVVTSPSERLGWSEIFRRLRAALADTVVRSELPATQRFRDCRLAALAFRRGANVSGEAVGAQPP